MAGNDAYTKSLLHLNADYADVAAGGTHIWTGYGNAQIDTAIKKFGAGSLLLDGDGDYIDTPDSADWAMGNGDFTVDFWVKRLRYSIHEMLIGQSGPSGNNSDTGLTIYMNSAPLDGKTVSLLHMNGANNAISVIDSCRWRNHIWTFNGDAKLSTTSPKFGTASCYFNGTTDWIDTPDHADWTMGSGDFTVDFWVKRGAINAAHWVAGQINDTGSTIACSILLRFNANNTFSFIVCSGGTAYIATSTGTITDTNTWHHIACVRDGATLRLFIDGSADGTANIGGATLNDSSNKLAWGRGGEYASNYFNGRLDECRILKGDAVWTSNFTPPTSEYIYDRLQAGFCYGSSGIGITGTTDISDTNWHHVALCRSGNTMYLFLDGVSEGTVNVTGLTMNDVAYKMAIGREGEYTFGPFAGNIDEPRISKGIARWTTDFTPPTDEYNGWTPPGGESFVSWID